MNTTYHSISIRKSRWWLENDCAIIKIIGLVILQNRSRAEVTLDSKSFFHSRVYAQFLIVIGPCSAIATLAKLGTFSHISINGFGTCVGAFHPLEVFQQRLYTEGVYGHLQEMKCCSWTLFCHCSTYQTRHFFHININGFGTCLGAFQPLEMPQQSLSTEGVYGHLYEMKCCSWTLFYHCYTCWAKHFFSYKRQWFWDLY